MNGYLLLVLAIAYLLLVVLGLQAKARFRPEMWCSSNHLKQCSVFTVGQIMLDQMQVLAAAIVAAVRAATAEGTSNWR